MTTVFDQFTSTAEGMRLYQRERTIMEVTELICGELDAQKLSQSDLASLLGKSKSHVSQLLDGESNMTLGTIADVFTAMGCELHVSAAPIGAEIPAVEYQPMQLDLRQWSSVTGTIVPNRPTFTIEQLTPQYEQPCQQMAA